MEQGFPLFKALSEEARRSLNSKRTELKSSERTAWQVGRDHCAALAEDHEFDKKRRKIAEARRKNRMHDDKGNVNLRAFEKLMLGVK